MNHKTNPLKNISKKSKNFSQFLNFILKKIISLQELNKGSVFATFLSFENVRNLKMCQEIKPKTAEMRTCVFGTWVISYNLERRIMWVRDFTKRRKFRTK